MKLPTYPGSRSESAENLHRELRRADEYYGHGDLAAARDCLDKARALAPAEPGILTALGSLDFQLGHYEKAGQSFLTAAAIRPDLAGVHTQLAAVWLRLRNRQAFDQAIRSALRMNPEDVNALRLLAKVHMEAGEYLEAARCYHRVLSLEYRDLDSLLLLGKCFYRLHELSMARLVYERALQLDPHSQAALDNLALVKRLERAQAGSDTLSEDEPDSEIIVLTA
jgi:Flp pilus assembly protein TadD